MTRTYVQNKTQNTNFETLTYTFDFLVECNHLNTSIVTLTKEYMSRYANKVQALKYSCVYVCDPKLAMQQRELIGILSRRKTRQRTQRKILRTGVSPGRTKQRRSHRSRHRLVCQRPDNSEQRPAHSRHASRTTSHISAETPDTAAVQPALHLQENLSQNAGRNQHRLDNQTRNVATKITNSAHLLAEDQGLSILRTVRTAQVPLSTIC